MVGYFSQGMKVRASSIFSLGGWRVQDSAFRPDAPVSTKYSSAEAVGLSVDWAKVSIALWPTATPQCRTSHRKLTKF